MALACPDQTALDLEDFLHRVTFVVVDVETTGWDPGPDTLIEVAAARFTGGEPCGTFQSLIDPGVPVPEPVSALTGIDDRMLRDAPGLEEVLPAFMETIGGDVIVGHNVGFDVSFIEAAGATLRLESIANPIVDTLHLARRLLAEDVSNCKLRTLASSLHLEHRPSHRALEDVLATADLLHALIERATGYGVLRLGDLLAF